MDFLASLRRAAARLDTRLPTVSLIVVCFAMMPGASAAAEGESLEYSVKAAYLTKFGIYVEWPAAALGAPGSPLSLCVVGEDPFGANLDSAAGAQHIDGRALTVRRLKTAGRDSGCHILYINGSETAKTGQIIEALRGSGVLTVSEARGAAGPAPVISFVLKDNRVRFNIDEEAAAQNGLTISSKLLGLALAVKPKSGKEGR